MKHESRLSPCSQGDRLMSIAKLTPSVCPTSFAARRHASYVTSAQSVEPSVSAAASRNSPKSDAIGGGARGGGGGRGGCGARKGPGGGDGMPTWHAVSTSRWMAECVSAGHSLRAVGVGRGLGE